MAIEQKYVKLTHREQILLRPDTYIGSIQNEEREYWFYNKDRKIIEMKSGIYNPGYIKLFDEILTNASDHAIRTDKVTKIQVVVTENSISIENDGPGIPVVLHETEKVYIPELIFGHLLTSENYNDSEERFVGGRNGYGAKLTAIFSKNFIVETCDGKKKYYQEFHDNLLILNKAEISTSKKQFTRITYFPDFEKFGMLENDDNIKGILNKRAADIAAYNPKVEVWFNDEKIEVRKFDDYVNLFEQEEVFYIKLSENWEIAVTNGKNVQVSLVNGISTNAGGTHINYVNNIVANEIKTYLYKKIKGCTLTLSEIKSKFMLFVCCKIANPAFETQTKENLTTKITAEITKELKYTDAFFKRIFKSTIVESILDWYDQKQNADANKLTREVNKNLNKLKVDKLIDAKGDGKDRSKCTLALFEGDSASSPFRDYRNQATQGAFCLRGKFVNVSDIPTSKLLSKKVNGEYNYKEVVDLMAAIGLRLGEEIEVDKLRYAKILMYCDADFDGYSINALLINFLYKYWPELFNLQMVYRVETPIVVSQNIKSKKKINFYIQEEYDKWLATANTKEWIIKYKKGLAALSNDEYEDIILKPRLITITNDLASAETLNIWFGNNSELRKTELLKLQ